MKRPSDYQMPKTLKRILSLNVHFNFASRSTDLTLITIHSATTTASSANFNRSQEELAISSFTHGTDVRIHLHADTRGQLEFTQFILRYPSKKPDKRRERR